MSGVYDGKQRCIDCRDVAGTNCYCDDAAKAVLRERLSVVPTDALHFLDSGNYHYLSYFFLERIKEDFALVLFDKHPDFQMPSFGDILSCGGWVKNAWEDFPKLKKVYMVGVDPVLFFELKDVPKEVQLISVDEVATLPMELPIYVSIDKDVLSEEYVACDWNQGETTLFDMESACKILKNHRLLGVDICGEKKENPTAEELQKNEAVNEVLKNTFF